MTTVWVVTDDYGTKGIYDSMETVKAAYPGVTWERESAGWYGASLGLIAFERRVRTRDAILNIW